METRITLKLPSATAVTNRSANSCDAERYKKHPQELAIATIMSVDI